MRHGARSLLGSLPGIAFIILLLPNVAQANAGIPMLALVWPVAWLALLPVIALEGCLARRVLAVPWPAAFKVAGAANLMSTLVGIPICWMGLVALGTAGMGLCAGLGLGDTWLILPFCAPWLPPWARPWQIVAAAILLCVPFCFASVWVEFRIARWMLDPEAAARARAWSWRANLWSYSIIICGLLVYLAYVLSQESPHPIYP